jgi:hypothetical protein
MSKSYFVSHVQRHGFWIVACNHNGHYRDVGKYTTRQAAVKAADTLNEQESPARETFDMLGAL